MDRIRHRSQNADYRSTGHPASTSNANDPGVSNGIDLNLSLAPPRPRAMGQIGSTVRDLQQAFHDLGVEHNPYYITSDVTFDLRLTQLGLSKQTFIEAMSMASSLDTPVMQRLGASASQQRELVKTLANILCRGRVSFNTMTSAVGAQNNPEVFLAKLLEDM